MNSHDRSRSRRLAAALTSILASAAAPAHAQRVADAAPSRDGGQLQEITVTARKQAESILEVPFAISAIGAEEIGERNLKNILDIKDATPGLYLSEANSGRNDRGFVSLVFRGLSVPSLIAAGDAALMFVDGAPVLGGQLATVQNVERVEVMKGPQTAQFGRNTFSGALNIVTKTPSEEWGGQVGVEFDENSSQEYSASIEGPIAKDFASFRLAGISRDYHGTWDNKVLGGRLGDRSTDAGSLTIDVHPGDAFRLKLFGEYAKYDDGPGASFDLRGSLFGNCDLNGDGRVDWFCGKIPGPSTFRDRMGNAGRLDSIFQTQVLDKFSIFSDRIAKGPGLGLEALSTHAILDVDLPASAHFQAIAAYHSTASQIIDESARESTLNQPCTPVGTVQCLRPFVFWQFLVERDLKDRYFEARLSSDTQKRFRGSLGVSYVSADVQSSNVGGEAPPPTGARLFSNAGFTEVRTKGVFGAVYADVTPKVTLSAEARWQADDIAQTPFGSTQQLQKTFDSVGGRLAFKYALADDVQWFVNVANGFRPGTFNSRLLTLPPAAVAQLETLGAQLTVNEEKIKQVETGLKGRFLDGRLQGSLVVYAGKINDQQVTNNATVPIAPGVTTLISYATNTGETKMKGIELEGAAKLGGGFMLRAALAYNDTKVQKAFCGNCVPLFADANTAQVGKRFPNSPAFQSNVEGSYTGTLSDGVDWYARAEYIHESTKYGDELNLSETGARNVVNARVGIDWRSVNVELFGANLTNDMTYIGLARGSDVPTLDVRTAQFALPEQRRFGLRASYRF